MPASALLIPLGSGQVAAAGVGNKAALLDRARRAGLPVPHGYVLLAEADARLPYVPAFSRKIAVRSAFSAEDHPWESLAGFFLSKLWVDASDLPALEESLQEVRDSASRRAGEFRRDILLLEMVDAQRAGVAFTETNFEDDLVNWTRGTGERLVSGLVRGETLELPKLRAGERSSLPKESPLFAERLQALLRDVRRAFGPYDWDIEWADDGRRCWLLQVRPISRPPRRNEIFTSAYHKEILPDLPSRFMTGIIASCAHELFEYYRRGDPSLPSERPFIEIFEGRPLINLSLLCDMMRMLGLPTRLVTDNIGAPAGRVFPANPRRLFAKRWVLLKMGIAQLLSPGRARRAGRAILRRTETSPESFTEAVESLRWIYVRLVLRAFALTAAMSGPLMLLRRLGLIEVWTAHQRSVAGALRADLVDLKRRFPQLSGEGFDAAWAVLVERHGHRGVYESDIARPRYHESPGGLLASLRAASPQPPSPRPIPPIALFVAPFWWQASRAIRAREYLREESLRAFDRLRQSLLLLAGRIDMRPETLWMLTDEEVIRLDSGWRPSGSYLEDRRREIRSLSQCRLPDLLRRNDDVETFYRDTESSVPSAAIRGESLSRGAVEGRAWVPAEPSAVRPEGWDRESTILVARSIDAGWIPALFQVAGVIVEIGGDLCHGSIILREAGLPAVTNVPNATRLLRTGIPLRLDAASGLIELLNETPLQTEL